MKSVKLTGFLRDKITDVLCRKAFREHEEESQALHSEKRAYADKVIHPLLYTANQYAALTKAVQEQVAPRREHATIVCSETGGKLRVEFSAGFLCDCLGENKAVPKNIFDDYARFAKAITAVSNRSSELWCSVHGKIASFSTTKQLCDLWPEATAAVEEVLSKKAGCTTVVVADNKEINALLGL